MKIAAWNVNSLNVRLPQVTQWLKQTQTNILCLQELKQENHKFNHIAFEELGYHCAWSGQKTYNGVAIISNYPLYDVVINNPHYEDAQQRMISATTKVNNTEIRIICVYCPNGGEVDSDKYEYKMKWFEAFRTYLAEQQQQYTNIIVLGDYNIAPDERDHPLSYNGERLIISTKERAHFNAIVAQGFIDSFRLFDQPEKTYSWWDYRNLSFRRNNGMRIDHILITAALKEYCQSSIVDKEPRRNEQPSDHAPVVAHFNL